MKHLFRWAVVSLLVAGLAECAAGQARPLNSGNVAKTYERLLKQIDAIPMYDNHAHPGFADDSDLDAMAAPPDESSTLRLSDDNPEFVAAAKALFQYPYDDFKPEHAKWLADKKKAAEAAGGSAYFDQLLDKLNVDICLANRAMMAPYLDTKRFHWVFFGDSFFYPFDNSALTASTPDMGVYVPLQEKMLSRFKKQEGLERLPADLAGYEEFVRRTLADNQQKQGGVAIKFEAAYFRSLKFTDPPREHAEAVYNKYRAGGIPTAGEYTQFQDYIFRVMVDQAGKLHLPMHFHTAVGIGDYFSLHNGNVLNLENVVRDPRYKNVTFVLVHGGWPYEKEAALMTAVKNVYLDTSFQSEILYPSQFKDVLKQLLTLFPNKMMYGSDAFPFNDSLGAEESMWLAARTTRTALAAALAELVDEGAISEARALELARNYLHDNAARLYGEKK
ncbi:MAG TPA: amidohydrolase family protein [Candidatus Saccharimonadales bacterium]|nr:amidohydrolase family protein [Candidatus Saccharimonadales bacterium]